MRDLVHKLDIGGSFTDLTIDLNNYDVEKNTITLSAAVDYLYTGLYKPFKNLFVSVESNVLPGSLTIEYYNGTNWEPLSVIDESVSYSRSGFIRWDIPDDWANTTVDGSDTLFFIRVTGDIEVELNGVNMLFSNDADLREHYRGIYEYLGEDTSFVALQQASRKDVIQKINNSGKFKVSEKDGTYTDLTVWDFERPEQLRNASAYLCLSKIFAGVSDSADGKFFQLSRSFRSDYKAAVDTYLLNLDENDDGKEDEGKSTRDINASRIVFV